MEVIISSSATASTTAIRPSLKLKIPYRRSFDEVRSTEDGAAEIEEIPYRRSFDEVRSTEDGAGKGFLQSVLFAQSNF